MTGSARSSFARLLMMNCAAAVVILAGCDTEETTIVEPPPPSFACEIRTPNGGELPAPTPVARPDSLVRVTRSFGDSPVEGFVVMEPRDSGEWAVDLDGDGAPEGAGALEDGAEVPYRYTSVGVHEIRVRLRDGGDEQGVELPVVVNDPSATVVEEVFQGNMMGGVTVTTDGHEVWTGARGVPEVIRFAASNFEIRDRIPILAPKFNLAEGWASTPDGSRVLYVTKNAALHILDRQDPRDDQRAIQIKDGFTHAFFVQPLTANEILIGSEEGIALLDIDACEFERFVKIHPAWHFSVDSDASTVAVLDDLDRETWGVVVLALPGLDVLRRFSIPVQNPVQGTRDPGAIVFGPDDETLFITVDGAGEIPDELYVMDSRSGEISAVHALPVAPTGVFGRSGNPATLSRDGRFAVFPTGLGAYFVETDRGIPLYRTELVTCCEVAASPIENVFFITGIDRLGRVRLNR